MATTISHLMGETPQSLRRDIQTSRSTDMRLRRGVIVVSPVGIGVWR